jgi:hypothetical protein
MTQQICSTLMADAAIYAANAGYRNWRKMAGARA